ncbi:hypothetical protein [Citrifermentans bremense]|uniref:hypothetical protein n=1 Tax=Citrifermentans bremense TaxID=60035 RepID=UPI00047AC36E|nr:hypothetical protein [Citrifermentans bremense]
MKRRAVQLYWCLIVAVYLGGCGLTSAQRKDLESFGNAASTLGATCKEQLIASRASVIDMKRYRLAIDKMKLPPSPPDDVPQAGAREYYFSRALNLDAGLDKSNIDTRVAAVDVLQRYGKLLVAFTTESHEKEITEAAGEFAKSVGKFPGNPMTGEEIDGLGRIVTSAGGILVEHHKKEVLENVVPKVAPLIEKICDSLEQDFDPKNGKVYANVLTVQNRLADAAIEGLKIPGESMSDRLLLIDGFALAEKSKKTVETTSPQILKSISSLRKANRELADVIRSHKVGLKDIKEFGKDVSDLSKGVKPYLDRF